MTSLLNLAAASLALSFFAATPVARADVTLINVFEVPEGKLDETMKAWEAARDFLSEQPGYVSTALHQSLDERARFQLINVAIWKSAADFRAATTNMRDQGVFPRIEGLGVTPALYEVVEEDKACRWKGPGFGRD